MPIHVLCSSCDTRLKIGDNLLGKRLKCPACKGTFVAQDSDPPKVVEKAAEVREEEESRDEEEAPSEDRPKKKKGKKKKRRRSSSATDPTVIWWLLRGGGVAAFMFFLLGTAVLAQPPIKFYAFYLLFMLPVGTVIFFAAMYLSSIIFEAVEIGEIHVALFKAFFLVSIVNVVSLIPFGGLLAFVIWFAGIMILFQADPWEARALIFTNWALNLGVKLLIFAAFMSLTMNEQRRFDDEFRNRGVPDRNVVWDQDDGQQIEP